MQLFPDWISQLNSPQAPLFTRIDTGYRSTDDYYMALMSGRCDFILFYRSTGAAPYSRQSEFEVQIPGSR